MTSKLSEDAKGVFIIAATPFTDDGALDLASVDTLTDFYLRSGVHGFTLLGMMGEAHKLTAEESISVVDRVAARAQGRQIIVGVSHAGLENVRRLAHEAMMAGAAGVMVAPPAGLRGDDGVVNYYTQVFEALGPDIPVVYQDYPQATGVYLPPPVFERLVDSFEQLVMLKHEDAPGLAKLTRIREGEKKPGRRRVSILVGNGGLHYPQEMRRGADGAMTGFAWPEMLVQVYELFAAGKPEEAEDLFDIYLPLVRHEVQPAIGLALRKEVLFRRGAIKSPKQRLPGSSLTPHDRAELDSLIVRMERRLAASGRAHKLAASGRFQKLAAE
jgi:4-hydroxy-tetrahydrodipicolinate synthase